MLEKVITMTDLSDLILETLKQRGDWMTRQDIAKAMNRPGRMPPYDIQLLEKLAKDGLIEAAQRPTGAVRLTWMYRSIQGKE